jgi:putative DNA primase/helicase
VGTKPDGSPVFEKPNLKGYKFSTPDGVQGFHTVGQIEAGQPVHIVEGIGAAWACYQATGHASVVTFGVGNTKTVASTIQQHHPEARIVLVPDVGQEKAASKVAKELGCAVAIMDSGYPEARELSDNYDAWDFLQAQDPEALADLLDSAQQPTKAVPLRCGGGSIPTESERQPAKYVVLDEGVEDAYGQRYKAGVWYFGIKPGTETKPDTPINMWICSPLYLEASTADAQDNSHGLLLHFKNKRGNWRDWAMPMAMLAGDCKELRAALLDMGVKVDPHNRQKLPDYLLHKDPKKELLCALQPGWVDSRCKAFALPDGVIGPDAASVVYQSESKADSDFGTAGTLEGWQAGIAAMAVGNPMLALSLCAAFAGPVLEKVNAESGGPHLIGASSTGKSSLMAGAVSVWGSPAYKRGWRTTSNGLEAVAAAFNDCLLALDEISEADPKDVGATVYMLGNGQGKQRADRSGGFRRVARWRVSVLSNGERGIATSMAEGGYRIKAGQEVRVFDVPCTNRAHGVWDVLHQHPDGRALSDSIKNEAKAHYGHAGRAFVAKLAAEGADLGEWLAAIRARDELSSKGEGQEQRIAGRFAVLALAGELATRYGITGWPPGEAIRACAVGLEAWRSSRTDQSGKNTEQGQIVQALTDFIDKHGDSRFSDADALPDVLQQPRPPITHNRAGYWRNTDTGRVYLFNSAGLRDALKVFDFHRSIAYLQQAGIMGPLEGKRGQTPKQYKIQNTNSRYFEIRPDAAVGVAV